MKPQTGVSTAATSARLGLDLLIMVLETVAQRKSFTGDRARLESICGAARRESERLANSADEDIATYTEYLKSRRLTGRLIDVPMGASRSAMAGLDLCADAAGMVQGAIAADLGTAAILLAGAVRAMLINVDVNLRQLPLEEAIAERKQLEDNAVQRLESVLRQVATG